MPDGPAGHRAAVPPRVQVRPREPRDLPPLLALLQRTHEQEGYPVRPAAVAAWWLAAEDELWSAVATDGDHVHGHVALHPTSRPGADGWCAATGVEPEGLAVVSRLFTDRSVPGTGAALLVTAADEARARGRVPVLEVDPDGAACAWYGRRGWRQVGTARRQWGPRTVDAVLMTSP